LILLGVFIARSNGGDTLVTRNMVVGESVYGEERISTDVWNLLDCFNA
jgi:fibrillarin-like rRNA methylase